MTQRQVFKSQNFRVLYMSRHAQWIIIAIITVNEYYLSHFYAVWKTKNNNK